jgi:two-component system, cell cycle sensor histidine kinase and response regulator CckA
MPQGGTLTFSTALRNLDENYCREQPYEMRAGMFLQTNIRDTGSGMDVETCRHIFEPFFTTKDAGKGTGLGLASVYGTMKQHRGAVQVYSELGHGSCFKIFLPLTRSETEPVPLPIGIEETIYPAHILVVDDEEMVARWIGDALQMSGFQVNMCYNGSEAVDFFRLHWQKIDLVILDMIMPQMGGKETFQAMRLIQPDVKVIIASGFSIEGEAQNLLENGARGFLQKPFQMSELVHMINSVRKD